MKIIHNAIFISIALTLGIIISSAILALLIVELFPQISPYNIILLTIDFSFLVFILIGFKLLKSNSTFTGNAFDTISYFFLALLLCTIWFFFSPIIALSSKEWSVDLQFSANKAMDVINNPISFQSYRFLKIILIGPILEEIFYRKIILSSLLEKYGVSFSIIFSSLLFSLGHMDFDYSIVFFVFGVGIGLFYWKTKNIYLTILLHIFINSLTLFLI